MALPRPLQDIVERVAASDAAARFLPRVVPPLDRFLHRISRGRVMLSRPAIPAILLTTTGARSGLARQSPLAAVPLEGRYYVVGSNFGGRSHPGWSHNLLADPRATMSLDGTDVAVEAELLGEHEKDSVWPRLCQAWPPYRRYAERSGRDLRVFRLTPRPPGDAPDA